MENKRYYQNIFLILNYYMRSYITVYIINNLLNGIFRPNSFSKKILQKKFGTLYCNFYSQGSSSDIN